jgi:hypothetical protein
MTVQVTDWHGFANDYSLDPHTNVLRRRRQSNVNIDAIHDVTEETTMAPAQLYATESGQLFHSGKIALVTVGLPARGKTYVLLCTVRTVVDITDILVNRHVTVAISRFLKWYSFIKIKKINDIRWY